VHRSFTPRNKLKRIVIRGFVTVSLSLSLFIALIYFKQHSMVYHPRPYGAGYAQALPTNGEEIFYTLPFGKQTAFYIPARNNEQLPSRLWVAFCGNGSLALDWTTILAGYPNPNDAFLLLDYPGYGKCQGYASIASTRASTDAALNTLAKRLALSEDEMEPRLAPLVIPSVPPLRSISQGVIASSELSQSRRSPLCARRPPALSLVRYHIC